MTPEQRDGSPIYPRVFAKLERIAKRFEAHGYVERGRRPNLFVRDYRAAKFYADFGGSDDVTIWEDPRPLFYWYFATASQLDLRTRQRVVFVEWQRLATVPKRLAYALLLDHPEVGQRAEARFIVDDEDTRRVILPT